MPQRPIEYPKILATELQRYRFFPIMPHPCKPCIIFDQPPIGLAGHRRQAADQRGEVRRPGKAQGHSLPRCRWLHRMDRAPPLNTRPQRDHRRRSAEGSDPAGLPGSHRYRRLAVEDQRAPGTILFFLQRDYMNLRWQCTHTRLQKYLWQKFSWPQLCLRNNS